jgi:hypothetical protein
MIERIVSEEKKEESTLFSISRSTLAQEVKTTPIEEAKSEVIVAEVPLTKENVPTTESLQQQTFHPVAQVEEVPTKLAVKVEELPKVSELVKEPQVEKVEEVKIEPSEQRSSLKDVICVFESKARKNCVAIGQSVKNLNYQIWSSELMTNIGKLDLWPPYLLIFLLSVTIAVIAVVVQRIRAL